MSLFSCFKMFKQAQMHDGKIKLVTINLSSSPFHQTGFVIQHTHQNTHEQLTWFNKSVACKIDH